MQWEKWSYKKKASHLQRKYKIYIKHTNAFYLHDKTLAAKLSLMTIQYE